MCCEGRRSTVPWTSSPRLNKNWLLLVRAVLGEILAGSLAGFLVGFRVFINLGGLVGFDCNAILAGFDSVAIFAVLFRISLMILMLSETQMLKYSFCSFVTYAGSAIYKSKDYCCIQKAQLQVQLGSSSALLATGQKCLSFAQE